MCFMCTGEVEQSDKHGLLYTYTTLTRNIGIFSIYTFNPNVPYVLGQSISAPGSSSAVAADSRSRERSEAGSSRQVQGVEKTGSSSHPPARAFEGVSGGGVT